MIDAELAVNFPVVWDIEDQEICLFPDFETTDRIAISRGVRRIDCRRGDCLFGRESQA